MSPEAGGPEECGGRAPGGSGRFGAEAKPAPVLLPSLAALGQKLWSAGASKGGQCALQWGMQKCPGAGFWADVPQVTVHRPSFSGPSWQVAGAAPLGVLTAVLSGTVAGARSEAVFSAGQVGLPGEPGFCPSPRARRGGGRGGERRGGCGAEGAGLWPSQSLPGCKDCARETAGLGEGQGCCGGIVREGTEDPGGGAAMGSGPSCHTLHGGP